MSRATRILLIAGCTVVLLLELPRSASTVRAAWNGPYAAHARPAPARKVAKPVKVASRVPRLPEPRVPVR